MFAVLRLENPERTGIISRILHRMKRRKIVSEEVRTPFGAFQLITAFSGREQVPWERVEEEAGRMRGRMVLPQGLTVPENCSLARFDPVRLTEEVLCQTAARVMERVKVPLYRKTAVLVDREGQYPEFVRPLICQCMTVQVITDAKEVYGRLAEDLMEELGAGIVVSANPGLCAGAALVLAPNRSEAAVVSTRAPVLTAGSLELSSRSKLVGEPEVILPQELAGYLPPGIAALDFAGAFYELGSWRPQTVPEASSLRCGRNRLAPAELESYIRRIL